MKDEIENIYELSVDEVLKKFNTSVDGLSDSEANDRFLKNGNNALVEEKKISGVTKFFLQFKDPMIIILIVAAVLSYFVSKSHGESQVEATVIVIIIILNAFLSFIQEMKAEKSIDALKKMSNLFIKVKRDSVYSNIESEKLVIGDIIHLEAGDYIPADIRFISVTSLKTNESALTGESEPVLKITDALSGNLDLSSRLNIGYSGSSVLYGSALAVVISTGMDTELGKIAGAINSIKPKPTPLQVKINEITKLISIVVVIVACITFVTEFLKGSDLTDILMISISLAVAGIPEGLMSVITITLSSGVQSLAREKSIIRKLSSVETLGAAQIICSDKTGTLTQNKMSVKKFFWNKTIVSETAEKSENLELILKICTLCNNTKINGDTLLGDPTETALIEYANTYNYPKYDFPRISEFVFDSDRKMMSVVNKDKKNFFVSSKGAVEKILKKCNFKNIDGKITKLTKNDILEIEKNNEILSDKAFRVLACAYKEVSTKVVNESDAECDLIFAGLVAMIDPPRPEAKDAVLKCFDAGITPVMITGDNLNTAKAIASEIGIYKSGDIAITGDMLDKMSDDELKEKIFKIRVYARVTPSDKMRIVSAFKSQNVIVAMTGDGVNDAPALKEADIGIGMGITGTEVSKSVSSMVLADDNFATIVTAVEEGRRIYKNIQNVIVYLLATNIMEVVIIFTSTLVGINILTPLQILWINLVTDTIPAIALGLEAGDPDAMKQKPRNSEDSFFTPFLKRRILVASVIKIILIICLYFLTYINFGDVIARGSIFILIVFMELIFAICCRSDDKYTLTVSPFKNMYLVYAILFTAILQFIVIENSFLSNIFSIPKISGGALLLVIEFLALSFVLFETSKMYLAKYYKN